MDHTIHTYRGHTGTLGELKKIFGFDRQIVQERLDKEWLIEVAIETPVIRRERKANYPKVPPGWREEKRRKDAIKQCEDYNRAQDIAQCGHFWSIADCMSASVVGPNGILRDFDRIMGENNFCSAIYRVMRVHTVSEDITSHQPYTMPTHI